MKIAFFCLPSAFSEANLDGRFILYVVATYRKIYLDEFCQTTFNPIKPGGLNQPPSGYFSPVDFTKCNYIAQTF